MSVLVLLVLILAMTGYSSANWCICRSDVSDTSLQKSLDYACGAGADCTPILQNGVCYQPNTVRGHCSYAVNSYFQRKGQAVGTCDFSGTTSVSTTDPSPGGTCVYPASPSSAGTSTTSNATTTPSTTTPSILTPTTPSTTTGGVVGGGFGSSLGPSGTGLGTDTSDSDFTLHKNLFFLLLALWFSGLVLLWG